MTAVDWLQNELNTKGKLTPVDFYQALEMEKQKFEDYASFAIYCDRQNLPILKHDEFFKLLNKTL